MRVVIVAEYQRLLTEIAEAMRVEHAGELTELTGVIPAVWSPGEPDGFFAEKVRGFVRPVPYAFRRTPTDIGTTFSMDIHEGVDCEPVREARAAHALRHANKFAYGFGRKLGGPADAHAAYERLGRLSKGAEHVFFEADFGRDPRIGAALPEGVNTWSYQPVDTAKAIPLREFRRGSMDLLVELELEHAFQTAALPIPSLRPPGHPVTSRVDWLRANVPSGQVDERLWHRPPSLSETQNLFLLSDGGSALAEGFVSSRLYRRFYDPSRRDTLGGHQATADYAARHAFSNYVYVHGLSSEATRNYPVGLSAKGIRFVAGIHPEARDERLVERMATWSRMEFDEAVKAIHAYVDRFMERQRAFDARKHGAGRPDGRERAA